MAKGRQQTFAKLSRERRVRERRERKQEKKHAAAAERKAQTSGEVGGPVADASIHAPGRENA